MKQTKRDRQSPPGGLLEVEHEKGDRPLSPSHPHSGKALDLIRWPDRGQIPDQHGRSGVAKATAYVDQTERGKRTKAPVRADWSIAMQISRARYPSSPGIGLGRSPNTASTNSGTSSNCKAPFVLGIPSGTW